MGCHGTHPIPWRPHNDSDLALTHQGMDTGPLGVSGTRALAADPWQGLHGSDLLCHIQQMLNRVEAMCFSSLSGFLCQSCALLLGAPLSSECAVAMRGCARNSVRVGDSLSSGTHMNARSQGFQLAHCFDTKITNVVLSTYHEADVYIKLAQ